jgi:hypothetical protein
MKNILLEQKERREFSNKGHFVENKTEMPLKRN